jgi:hypothetical protein
VRRITPFDFLSIQRGRHIGGQSHSSRHGEQQGPNNQSVHVHFCTLVELPKQPVVHRDNECARIFE